MPGYNTEADYENAIIELFRNDLGYEYVYGPDVERDFRSPLYDTVLEESLYRLNKGLPADAINDALFKLRNFENGELVQKNAEFMEYLQSGIPVRYLEKGEERSGIVYLADYSHPENNSFIVANQWTFIENSNKRPDIILFLNGLPVVLVELKSPSREETDASEAYRQLRNYMQEIPSMFIYNAICVMSDQSTSKAGTITSGEDRFMEWKTKDGSYENTQYAQFDTFFEGLFQKDRLLDIIKNFICFSNEGIKSFKILAGYHQYFAVRKAIESTKHATVTDGKGGVFWHTQGSGKSLSMVFYAHLLQDALDSPTIVVLTDRNDLDDQLYGQFAKCKKFLRQEPIHAESREHLKSLLAGRQANGIIFTTMQKFEESHEPLSERRNIVVMADEAHRGQYGLAERIKITTNEDGEEVAKRVVGTARIIRNSLPNATYIGFTGTPISSKDRSTREVFGDYIDIYDMTQAVEDGATRPVYYESRVIKLHLDEATLRLIDAEYDIICQDLFHHYDYSKFMSGTDLERAKTISGAVNFIMGRELEKERDTFLKEALMLHQALSLCSSLVDEPMRFEAAFFESVRVLVIRLTNQGGGQKISLPEMNARINELLKQSIKSDGVINLFSDVNSEFSLFDPKFLEEISKMKEKNLAVELLKKLIAEQVQIYRRTNVVKSEKFSEIMQRAMNAYLNGMLTNEQVIDEMMKLAKQIAAAHNEGKELGLTADELAFYDALTKPQAIKDFYENDELIAITKELAETLRKNRTIDWNRREQARARMRMLIKRLLKKHKYPPEGMDDAVQTVMTQCELWTDNMEE